MTRAYLSGGMLLADVPSTLTSMLVLASRTYRDESALWCDGRMWSYSDLFASARRLAYRLRSAALGGSALVAVAGNRTSSSYLGVLAVLLGGYGYVPLNPGYPRMRTFEMLRESGAKHLIADRAAVQALALADYEVPLVILVPDEEGPTFRIGPHHVVPCAEVLRRGEEYWPDAVAPSQLAYLMFTSGSTGRPKGVGVSQVNAATCIHLFGERYGLGPGDTCSQNFELTFDLSVFDMFVCWTRGACLCVPPEAQRKAPGKFYRERGLTLWFSVPSLGAFMERLGQLKARPFPDLKWILFCGERLPISVAMTWQRAMPQAQVENLYGPTEVTIACTVHTMGDSASENAVNGSVPIGWPLEGHHVAILDGDGQIVPRDEQGELCVGGPQVTPGYWNDPEKTQARYFEASPEGLLGSADQGPLVRWYRTGDLVRMDADGQLQHLGRLDDQVKLGGFRVELGEVESVMRHALGSEDVAVIAAARSSGGPLELVGFVVGPETPEARQLIRQGLESHLPPYMHPARLHFVEGLPRTTNGKLDRNELRRRGDTSV